MKADKNIIAKIEKLLKDYEIEIKRQRKARNLKDSTVKTYLRHANTFVRWCKDDFVPGGRRQK